MFGKYLSYSCPQLASRIAHTRRIRHQYTANISYFIFPRMQRKLVAWHTHTQAHTIADMPDVSTSLHLAHPIIIFLLAVYVCVCE